MKREADNLIRYHTIITQHGADSEQAREFRDLYRGDKEFERRAAVLDRLATEHEARR